MANDLKKLRKWRRRGLYSESCLIKILFKKGYNAVRIPCSNPSLNPLPDIMACREMHVYAFEVKNADYYAYFPRNQIEKLFKFLECFFPLPLHYKHAVLAAHLGKKWKFKEVEWNQRNKIPEQMRILKRDKGNFDLKHGEKKLK
jgi:Holliday junction resolvase